MARYKEDHRETLQFIVGSLDLLLPPDSVARAIRAGLDALDFSIFDTLYRNDATGRPALDPRSLAAVWILGMLRGETSSVRLAALCAGDIEFRWLSGDAPVEKSTLCDFRRGRGDLLARLGAQVLGALGRNGLLPGEHMGVDGTVVRAASSRHAVRRRRGMQTQRTRLEQVLRDRLSGAEEEGAAALSPETEALRRRKERLDKALGEMDSLGLLGEEDRLTVTEPEAGLKRQKDGSFAPGHNAQVVTDLASGAIVHAQVVGAGGDGGQLQPQLEGARAALEGVGAGPGAVRSITADGAYHDTLQLAAIERSGVCCYVPEDRAANRTAPGVSPEYRPEAFAYDGETDTMRCPLGERLRRRKLNNSGTAVVYQAPTGACGPCPAKPQCCPKSREGRCVSRPLHRGTLDTVAGRLESAEGKRRRRARWVVCEGAFARLAGLLHWRRCRMWGREGAQMELLWRQFAHNLLLLTGVWKPMVPAGTAG
ncbi:MAG: IS1182 family transposase [Opitutae bacterium]|nr:IS1182 family transposase [Opitutae bacterium]